MKRAWRRTTGDGGVAGRLAAASAASLHRCVKDVVEQRRSTVMVSPGQFRAFDATQARDVPLLSLDANARTPTDAGRVRAFMAARIADRFQTPRLSMTAPAGFLGAYVARRLAVIGECAGARERSTRGVITVNGEKRAVPIDPSVDSRVALPEHAHADTIVIHRTQDAANQDAPFACTDNRMDVRLRKETRRALPATRCAVRSTPAHGSFIDGGMREAGGAVHHRAIKAIEVFEHAPADAFVSTSTGRTGASDHAGAWVGLGDGRRMPALN
jgi:hypothetical protein